jgi:hypothetical protein
MPASWSPEANVLTLLLSPVPRAGPCVAVSSLAPGPEGFPSSAAPGEVAGTARALQSTVASGAGGTPGRIRKIDRVCGHFRRKRIGFIHSDSDTGRKHLANLPQGGRTPGRGSGVCLRTAGREGCLRPAQKALPGSRSRVERRVVDHGSYAQYAEILRASRKLSGDAQFLAVNSGAQQMVRLLGADAEGLIFSQVVPFPMVRGHPVVREYPRCPAWPAELKQEPSFSSLEGFINAKVLAEAPAARRPGESRAKA